MRRGRSVNHRQCSFHFHLSVSSSVASFHSSYSSKDASFNVGFWFIVWSHEPSCITLFPSLYQISVASLRFQFFAIKMILGWPPTKDQLAFLNHCCPNNFIRTQISSFTHIMSATQDFFEALFDRICSQFPARAHHVHPDSSNSHHPNNTTVPLVNTSRYAIYWSAVEIFWVLVGVVKIRL